MARKAIKAESGGFSLSELLVAMLIIGQIATFTIPKVLASQQNLRYRSAAKEAAATISAAYQTHQLKSGLSAGTSSAQLTQYMNYVATTTANIDDKVGGTTLGCGTGPGNQCVVLHNGGALRFNTGNTFSGTATTNAVWFFFDPDISVVDGTTNGPGKSVQLWLMYNGRITSEGSRTETLTDSFGTWGPCSTCDPSWFSWN